MILFPTELDYMDYSTTVTSAISYTAFSLSCCALSYMLGAESTLEVKSSTCKKSTMPKNGSILLKTHLRTSTMGREQL